MAWKLHSKSGLDFGPEKCSRILKVLEVFFCARALSDRAGVHVVICSPLLWRSLVVRLRQREINVCSVFLVTTLYCLAPSCVRVCAIVRSSDPDFFGFRFGHILSIYRASWSSPPGPPFGGSETIPFITGTFVADVTTPVTK